MPKTFYGKFSGEFLNTELDFVYQRARQLATNLPMVDSRLQGFRISGHDLTATPISPQLYPSKNSLLESSELKECARLTSLSAVYNENMI